MASAADDSFVLLQKLFEDIQRRKAAKPTRAAEPVSEQPSASASKALPQQISVTASEAEVPAPREVGTFGRQSAPPESCPVSGVQPDSGGSGSPQTGNDASSSSATSMLSESTPQQGAGPRDGESEPGGGSDRIATPSQMALGSGDDCLVDPVRLPSLPGTGEMTDTEAGC